MEKAAKASKNVAEYFNCKGDILTCLRNVPAEKLVEANEKTVGAKWLPVVDGKFVTDTPINMLTRANFDAVQVLIGVNKDEGLLFRDALGAQSDATNPDEMYQSFCEVEVRKSGSLLQNRICQAYIPLDPRNIRHVMKSMLDMKGDIHSVCPTVKLAEILKRQNAQVYMYHLTYSGNESTGGDIPNAVPHHAEIQWIFGAAFRQETYSNYSLHDEEFSKSVMDRWVLFAKYGDPVRESHLQWDPYKSDYPVYMELKMPSLFLHRGESIRESFCNLWP